MKKSNPTVSLILYLGLAIIASLPANAFTGNGWKKPRQAIPMVHATDLYHPHADPDDHFDLASLYSLSHWGLLDLKGILVDYPGRTDLSDPDVLGVAQLNYYTGLAVPVMIGTSSRMKTRDDVADGAAVSDLYGIIWLLNTLRNSPEPVVINIVGSATDVAIALKREPALFKKKCKAIYLNAGSAYLRDDKKLEYNVELNPSAYAAIFDAPCPVYWLPCFHKRTFGDGEYGTYYKFLQGDVLPYLPPRLQNYFLYMLDRKKGTNWFFYLNGTPETELLTKQGQLMRNMWCTAGFFHAAGKKVTPEGEIVDLDSDKESVYTFKPIKVSCTDQGLTTWEIEPRNTGRFIFHIEDLAKYQAAMTAALKSLLLHLPE